MKVLEKLGVSLIVFLLIYAFVSIGLRMLGLTTVYVSHMAGGILATIVGVVLLMVLMIKEPNDKP